MKSTSNFLTGLLLGVGAGMLLAPRSGKELRDEVERAVKDLQSGEGGDWKQKLNNVVDQVKSQVNQVVSQVQNKANNSTSGGDVSTMTPQDTTRQQYNSSVDALADNAHQGVSNAESSLKTDSGL